MVSIRKPPVILRDPLFTFSFPRMEGFPQEFRLDKDLLVRAWPLVELLQAYHRHRIYGLDHIPLQGRALIVVNHSFATYDILLLAAAIMKYTNRVPRSLGDRLLFKLPILSKWVQEMGIVEGTMHSARPLLEKEQLTLVAPGGMREALRPTTERYQLRWAKRRGFCRLALQTQSPIILAACPGADDLYTVYSNKLTKLAYQSLKFPLPIIRGWGPTLLPRPVQLTHVLSKPIVPKPLAGETPLESEVTHLHKQVQDAMEQTMTTAQLKNPDSLL